MARKQINQCIALNKPPETIFMVLRSQEETLTALTALKERKLVFLNLARLERSQAQRIVDCLVGCAQAVDSRALWVGEQIYLFAPSSVLIKAEKAARSRFLPLLSPLGSSDIIPFQADALVTL